MWTGNRGARRIGRLAHAAAALCVAAGGCDYKVPITARPTRQIDAALLGDWISEDGNETIKVRRLDDSTYVGTIDGDLFRAFHSDFIGTAFLSVQDLDSEDRTYAFVAYTLYNEGARVGLRTVNGSVVSSDAADCAAIQKLLKENAQDAELLNDEEVFIKAK